MNRWDKKEGDYKRKQERNEKIGRFMFVGAISFLAVYIFSIVLESYHHKCIAC